MRGLKVKTSSVSRVSPVTCGGAFCIPKTGGDSCNSDGGSKGNNLGLVVEKRHAGVVGFLVYGAWWDGGVRNINDWERVIAWNKQS